MSDTRVTTTSPLSNCEHGTAPQTFCADCAANKPDYAAQVDKVREIRARLLGELLDAEGNENTAQARIEIEHALEMHDERETDIARDIQVAQDLGVLPEQTRLDEVQREIDSSENNCDVAMMVRPTKSKGLYIQQVGRVLRPWPGKTEALVLDFVGAAEELTEEEQEEREQLNEAHILGPIADTDGRCAYGNIHEIETCFGCGTEDENGNQVTHTAPVFRPLPAAYVNNRGVAHAVALAEHLKREAAQNKILIITGGVLHDWSAAPDADITLNLSRLLRDPAHVPSGAMLDMRGDQDLEVVEFVMSTKGAEDLLLATVNLIGNTQSDTPVVIHVQCRGGKHRAPAFGLSLHAELGMLGLDDQLGYSTAIHHLHAHLDRVIAGETA